MKFGTKDAFRAREFKLIGNHAKINVRIISRGIFVYSPWVFNLLVRMKMSAFRLIIWVTSVDRSQENEKNEIFPGFEG